jgi:hypothetical protein
LSKFYNGLQEVLERVKEATGVSRRSLRKTKKGAK